MSESVIPPSAPHPGGRPSLYTIELAERICTEIACGALLPNLCKTTDWTPHISTVLRWLNIHDEFRDLYERAREVRADVHHEETIQIADTPEPGEVVETDSEGKVIKRTQRDMIEHRRLKVDTRKWSAAKMRPRKYGDRVDHTLASPTGGPVQVEGKVDGTVEVKHDVSQVMDAYREFCKGS